MIYRDCAIRPVSLVNTEAKCTSALCTSHGYVTPSFCNVGIPKVIPADLATHEMDPIKFILYYIYIYIYMHAGFSTFFLHFLRCPPLRCRITFHGSIMLYAALASPQ